MDIIRGVVTRVIDGDTFEVDVTHYHRENEYDYNTHERIRINSIDTPELPSRPGILAKQRLENQILGHTVELWIHARDSYGRLVADVYLLD